jgi:GntR family transcriptional regulator
MTGVGSGPVAEEVRRRILADITSGVYPPGARLGSERELAASLGVSRSTLRQVLAGLTQAGIVRRLPGRSGGTFVGHAKVERDLSRIAGLPSYLSAQGLRAGSRVLSTALLVPDDATGVALGLDGGDLVVDIVRLRLADGAPLSLDHTRLPAARFPDLLEQPLGGSLYELLEARYGVRIAESEERLEFMAATPQEAAILGVAKDAPLISVTRTARDADGAIVEYSHDLFLADRTRILVHSSGQGIRSEAQRNGHIVELRALG